MAKVVAFNCSPRKDGNTAHMIRAVLDVLESEGIETEMVQVGGNVLRGCTVCGACKRNKDMRCVFGEDGIDGYVQRMLDADGIIIGSPTYYSDMTPECKALIDRCGSVLGSAGKPLSRKVGAAVSAVRRAGGINTIDSIQHFFTINEMYIASSSYWNMSLSRDLGDFEKDEEGVRTMRKLGENMAYLLKRLQ
ncbi:MAG: flavodoxin family protein [Candidatus Methanomethylophilaceae archaeon]